MYSVPAYESNKRWLDIIKSNPDAADAFREEKEKEVEKTLILVSGCAAWPLHDLKHHIRICNHCIQ